MSSKPKKPLTAPYGSSVPAIYIGPLLQHPHKPDRFLNYGMRCWIDTNLTEFKKGHLTVFNTQRFSEQPPNEKGQLAIFNSVPKAHLSFTRFPR